MKTIACVALAVVLATNCIAGLPDRHKIGRMEMPKLYSAATCLVFQDCWVDVRSNLAKRIEINNKIPTPEIAQQIAFLQSVVDQGMTALRLAAYTTATTTLRWVKVTTNDGLIHRCRARKEADPASFDPVQAKAKRQPTYIVILLPEKYQQQRLSALTIEGGE